MQILSVDQFRFNSIQFNVFTLSRGCVCAQDAKHGWAPRCSCKRRYWLNLTKPLWHFSIAFGLAEAIYGRTNGRHAAFCNMTYLLNSRCGTSTHVNTLKLCTIVFIPDKHFHADYTNRNSIFEARSLWSHRGISKLILVDRSSVRENADDDDEQSECSKCSDGTSSRDYCRCSGGFHSH